LNLETLKKAIATLILLTVGVFLIHIYWKDIVPAVSDSLKILAETRIRYVILAFLVYLLSMYLFTFRWQQVLYCIDYKLKAIELFPILFRAIFVNNLTQANRTRRGLVSTGSFVFLERFISYGLSSLIGFLYLFYYRGFKIWKNIKLH
jgi:uncharacterized membrane protein YbhN (UPF0104 family)